MNAGQNVRSWLESHGFERFIELFEANEIDLPLGSWAARLPSRS